MCACVCVTKQVRWNPLTNWSAHLSDFPHFFHLPKLGETSLKAPVIAMGVSRANRKHNDVGWGLREKGAVPQIEAEECQQVAVCVRMATFGEPFVCSR